MKLTKQKTKNIYNILKKLYTYGIDNINNKELPKKALNKIIEIHDNKKSRSLPENGLYFVLMKWCERNTPEWLCKLMELDNISSDGWHAMCKSKKDITSTAFDNMPEAEFNNYFQDIQKWLAQFIFRCPIQDIMNEVRNIKDE